MVTKGALQNVLAVCSAAETGAGTIVDIAVVRDRIQQHFEEFRARAFARWASHTKIWGLHH